MVSEGTNVELALRDLQREIENLQEDRDKWKYLASQFANYGSCDYDDTGAKCHKCEQKWDMAIKDFKDAGGIL